MMKILQSSASSQTLKIIPRSYPELVDVVIKNEDTKDVTTLSDVTTVSNLGYLEIPSVFTLVEDTFYSFEVWDKVNVDGVDFIAANNEYISSPDQSYLPDTINELDLEIEFSNINADTFTNFISQISDVPIISGLNRLGLAMTIENELTIIIGNATEFQQFTSVSKINSGGNIKINGNLGNIEAYFNDTLIIDESITIGQDISGISGNLHFNGIEFNVGVITSQNDVTLSYVKLNNHIWTFSEGTGGTTTNSESVVSTLNSDVSTELMWSNEQNEIIYKGKIFCTNQESYSINNGEYTTRSRNNKYIVYGQ